jgi:hypothetical protein
MTVRTCSTVFSHTESADMKAAVFVCRAIFQRRESSIFCLMGELLAWRRAYR